MNNVERGKNPFDLHGFVFTKYLWVFYGAVLLFMASVLTLSLWYAYHQLKLSAYGETHSIAMAMDELNRRQLEAMAIPLEAAVAHIQDKGGLSSFEEKDLSQFFIQTKKTMTTSEVRSFFAVDREGHFVASSYESPGVLAGQSFKGDSEFDYVKTQKSFTVLSSSVSPVDRQKIIIMMKALRGPDGRFTGIVGVTKTVEQFEKFYKSLDLPYGVTFTMFRDDGKVLYRYPEDEGKDGKVSFSQEIRMDSEGYINSSARIGGVDKIGYYKFASEFGGLIYVGYNTQDLFKSWNLICRLSVGLFILFMGVLATLMRLAQRHQEAIEKSKAERIYKDQLVQQIQMATETLTGQTFLRELSLQMCKTFGVSNVAIGVLMPEHSDAVKFIANWVDGEWATEYVYGLQNTPFEGLKPGEFFAYVQNAHQIFSKDPLLSHRSVESCMGILLQDSEERAIGVILIYSDQVLKDVDLKRTIVSLFAARVGAELERVRTDEIRKEVEKLRRQIEQRSLQSEKLEAIGTLAEGIAHDFNNVLSIVLASNEKLINLHQESVQDMHLLDSIKRACHRARHLVSQILAFSRKDAINVQPILVRSIFSETMDFLRSTLPAQIGLVIDMDACGDLVLNADVNQLQQALMNLCVNAARYVGPHSGEIRITLRSIDIKDRSYVKWIIHSSGENLERDEIEKAFDPFYAQNLGLVVVQRIVTNHQGFIEIKSETGQGTTFEVFLPVLDGADARAAKARPFDFKSATKVMIVDDEPEIGLLIKELLEIEGLKVDAFSDPLKALEAFIAKQEDYFMIISDLSMPGMTGFEFANKVRDINQKISMILWSGYQQFLDQEHQNLNVKTLSKPVDVQKLLMLIQAELSQRPSLDIAVKDRGRGSEPAISP